MLAHRIDPTLVASLAADLHPVVFVVGTNGKTTTSRLTARILGAVDGRKPVANRSGANLRQGLASTLLAETNRSGRLRQPGRPGIFEVDELALDGLLGTVQPGILVILNLFRDQLDRFGEVEIVVDRWRSAFQRLPRSAILVSCADDPRVEDLVSGSGLAVLRFGLDSASPAVEAAREVARSAGSIARHTVADPVGCPICGEALVFEWRSIGHLGGWACPAGHVRRIEPDISVSLVQDDPSKPSVVEFGGAFGRASATIRLSGVTSAYDSAAAVAAAIASGIPADVAIRSLNGATPAFGRMEEASFRGRRLVLALVKNPASLTETAQVTASFEPDGLLLGLSDEPADGTDVSWIWDVDFGILARVPAVGLTGTRLDDLAVRLKYAAAEGEQPWPIVVREAVGEQALEAMVAAIRPGGTLVVLATYTSMLAVRAALVRRGAVPAMPR